ncbi:NAD(P)-dependent oxidoreductase [Candidatus Korobacter versatilis]|uniref:NAD(P)-dependent oxidoreductase n=1 Tax=Candidatus Korobacter versatilis TaxID=658062 RepID=UPI0003104325|nr:NAD(P)-dependent oxidoreductase [Candidatus Koribacter versatilis]
MKVGFLGLGNMGEPMAANLIAAGHQVTVWNRTAAKAEPLKERGVKVATEIKDAVQNQDVVCTMVADDHALRTILEGGLLEALPKGAVHVSHSTVSVAMAEELKREHGKRGQAFISAPVFGRPEAAQAKKLFVVVSGDPAVIEKVKPVLDAIGQGVTVIGNDPVQANVAKISGNFLIAAAMEAMGEAVALVGRYGVDPVQYMEFLTSTLFAAPVYKNYGMKIAKQEYVPVGFKAPLGLKDAKLMIAAGEGKYVPLPLASLIHDQMITAIAHFGEDVDWSVIAKVSAEHAGLK